MSQKEKFKELVFNGHKRYLTNISIDNVIFGYKNKELKVLLFFHPLDVWAITGGFISRSETLDDAAIRIVKDRTGLKKVYYNQFKAFAGPDRIRHINSFSSKMNEVLEFEGVKVPEDNWLNDYFITIGYYTQTEIDKVNPEVISENNCKWWNVNNLPHLMVDHEEIINEALKTLRRNLYECLSVYEFLPKKFTLGELKALHETILNKKLDKRNFSRKMLGLGQLNQLLEKKDTGAHRLSNLYELKEELKK